MTRTSLAAAVQPEDPEAVAARVDSRLATEASPEARYVSFRRVRHGSDLYLPAIAHLYRSNFPPKEQQPWCELLATVEDGTSVLFAAERAGQVVGFTLFALLPASESAVLLYTAATGGPGVGSQLFAYSMREVRDLGVRCGVVGEIERVEDADTDDERQVRRRRLPVHERWGCSLLPVPGYGMPDLAAARDVLLPLHLAWHAFETPVRLLEREYLRGLVAELYEVAYGRRRGDALLERVLQSVGSGCPAWPR